MAANNIMDSTGVYYIYPSNASTDQLVSIKFSGVNYTNWKRSMMLTLSAKNKLGFVNGTILNLASNSFDFADWERCNALITF